MISSWRRRRAARRAAKERQENHADVEMEIAIPNHFRCPITLDLMTDPVTLSTGITYDRQSIEKWIEAGNVTCPITNQMLSSLEPIPNHTIRRMIQDWCVENRSYGVERIPTPRIPVTSVEVLEIQAKIVASCKRRDQVGCQNLVAKIKSLIKESERNRKCITSNNTAAVLAFAFEEFAKQSIPFVENAAVLEEILSCLTPLFPLDSEASNHLRSIPSMDCIVWFLKSGDLTKKGSAILILKQLVNDHKTAHQLSEMEGAIQDLFKLIKEPICPATTKAALMVTYHIINSKPKPNPKTVTQLIDMGLVRLLLEMIVDTEKSISEKALGVLDEICYYDQGRESAYSNALTLPVVAKKIHRVSSLATEFSVSIIWKLCKNEKKQEGGVAIEALQMSVFQKLLLLLQVGCGEKTRDKATELLKLLNVHRDRVECIDSMDFKNLKRSL